MKMFSFHLLIQQPWGWGEGERIPRATEHLEAAKYSFRMLAGIVLAFCTLLAAGARAAAATVNGNLLDGRSSRRSSSEAANESPSPGGEGRGALLLN